MSICLESKLFDRLVRMIYWSHFANATKSSSSGHASVDFASPKPSHPTPFPAIYCARARLCVWHVYAVFVDAHTAQNSCFRVRFSLQPLEPVLSVSLVGILRAAFGAEYSHIAIFSLPHTYSKAFAEQLWEAIKISDFAQCACRMCVRVPIQSRSTTNIWL